VVAPALFCGRTVRLVGRGAVQATNIRRHLSHNGAPRQPHQTPCSTPTSAPPIITRPSARRVCQQSLSDRAPALAKSDPPRRGYRFPPPTPRAGWLSWRSSRQSKTARDAARTAEAAATTQAERAIGAAEDAAAAADRSARAAERSAAAHETHTALLQDAAEAAERFPWRIDRLGDAMDFRLVNLTNTRKYEVGVTGEPVRRPKGTGLHFDVVDGRERVELDLFVAMQTRGRRVTVSWRPTPDHTGDPWTQRLGLP
jgi:hypothetical protein